MTIIERALELVTNDSRIGLGSGHTAQAFVRALGERVRTDAYASAGCLPRRRRQVCPGRKAFRC
jgi:ribose 5-phosphate isomerase